ncbi:MAG: methyltransferase [Archaeoglobi archaeon]|nr:methyltransferase [Candidatus Mnemosynella bozhongmuii]
MRLRKLEMILERLEDIPNPDASMEQYSTPPELAARVLHEAHLRGELREVVDLGCGNGILAIGSALLGAEKVTGVDADPEAIETSRRNAEKIGVKVNFVCSRVEDFEYEGERCTVIMNPPFGAQKRHADRVFLKKALEIGKVIYSIHNRGSRAFVESFIAPSKITNMWVAKMPIKRRFKFHKKDRVDIEVEIYRIEVLP